MCTEELPLIIPALQRQQGSLRYFCNSNSVPEESNFYQPIHFMEEAYEFISQELVSEAVTKELRKMSSMFSWIDDDDAQTYFELSLGNIPACMDPVSIIASKTYTRGLIVISVYYDGVIYFMVQGGEGDQPLLDVRFPDVSRHGQGVHLQSYNDHTVSWRKLVLWHVMDAEAGKVIRKVLPKLRTISVATSNYEQTYCILRSEWDQANPARSAHHDVLFRFGSWCYSGRVQLTPLLSLSDIPYVIPALRMQQSRLDYLCDVNQVPTTSPFAPALAYVKEITPKVEQHVVASEETLNSLVERLSNMGLGTSVVRWLEGDSANSFFEFKIVPDVSLSERFRNIEMIVSKCYYPSGIITITIIYQFNVYVTVLENKGENPLLDSRFPDVSGKGRGYQLEAFDDAGAPDWHTLRKVSIWQTVGDLEQEFREKANETAEAKETAVRRTPSKAQADDLADRPGQGILTNSSHNSSLNNLTAALEEAAAESASDLKEIGSSNNSDYINNTSSNTHGSKTLGPEVDQAESLTLTTRAEEKTNPVSGDGSPSNPQRSLKAIDGGSPAGARGGLAPIGGGGRRLQALPHHVPKVESLEKKMEEIRKNMGKDGMVAPWDARGKPLGSLGGGDKK